MRLESDRWLPIEKFLFCFFFFLANGSLGEGWGGQGLVGLGRDLFLILRILKIQGFMR